MNLKEAYSILELEQTATPEEAKKQFRKLSKKLHPDNQDSGDEAKFKKINEAYQTISDPEKVQKENLHWNTTDGGIPTGFGNPFGKSKVFFTQNINAKMTISFSESILGCQKELKLTRQVKCDNCSGEGTITLSNGCGSCGGRGKVVIRQGNLVMVQTCGKCGGRNPTENCKDCSSKGIIEAETIYQVNIPGGIADGNILTLRGKGNFGGSFGPMDQYSDVYINFHIIPEPGLSLDKIDVICTCEISLQEALTGCKKIVNTIQGYQDIEIKSMSRHKDEVIISHLGVNKIGNQRVILDVKYPQDINKLLEVLNNSIN
jgi:molecular chaperone DnaJ